MTAEQKPARMPVQALERTDWRAGVAPVALFCAPALGVLAAWSIVRWLPATEGAVGCGLLAIGVVLALLTAALIAVSLRERSAQARSDRRFRDFAEAGSDWFWEMGPDLRFTWVSENIRQRTGQSPDWARGKRRSELGDPDDNPAAWQAHLRALELHQPFHDFVYCLRGSDGSRHWTRTSGKPMFDANGRFLGYRGASALCTDQVTALARAHHAEARLNAALSAMSDGFALYDAEDRLVLCNDAYRQMTISDPTVLAVGTPFETIARAIAQRLPAAKADPERWLAERMAQHRNPGEVSLRELGGGRWIRVVERRTMGGGIVSMSSDITELRRREQAVADSEARYALAFRGANEGIWDWDIENNRIYGSERLWELIGVGGPAGWRDGDVYTSRMHPDDLPAYRQQVCAHFRSEAPVYEAEYRLILGDGRIRWIRSRGFGVKSPDGTRIIRMAGSAADTTAAKEAEARLRRSEADLKAILDSARQAFVLLDRDGRVRAINRAGELAGQQILGCEIRPGAELVQLVPERERAPLASGIRRALSGETLTREHATAGPDGAPLWLEISYTPVRHAGGEIDGVCWTVLDVTERRRAVEALARSEERFRSLVENTQELFSIVDAKAIVQYVSDSARRVLGHGPDMLVGRDGGRLIHPDDRGIARNLLRRLIDTAELSGSMEVRFEHADGTWRRLEINAVSRFDDPAVRGIIMTARDVTARRAAEAELRNAKEVAETASRAKSNFLATVSHELRTPLNAIIGFSEIMHGGLFGPLPDRYRGYAADINHSGTHLLALINDILDVSKAEAGKLELYESAFALEPALEECLRLMHERAASAALRIVMRLPERLPKLSGDERKVKQIVLNLLSNAIKFTNPGGRIDLSVACPPAGGLAISVADTGIGIAAEDMPKALAAFGQVDSALNRKYVGTGLGLALVQAFARLHDAGFALDSTPEVGTTVTITFPAERVLAA